VTKAAAVLEKPDVPVKNIRKNGNGNVLPPPQVFLKATTNMLQGPTALHSMEKTVIGILDTAKDMDRLTELLPGKTASGKQAVLEDE
ncbi:hypothetical protein PSY31_23250, partial [Shigella flexneri]|nr:hypothetical protein [Shigella flexneri]